MDTWQTELTQSIAEARKAHILPKVRDILGGIYLELAESTQLQNPRCDVSGRCCHFDAYGHRLYVTTLELALFLHDLPTPPSLPSIAPPSFNTSDPSATSMENSTGQPSSGLGLPILGQNQSDPSPGSCRFLAGKQCSVHTIRPFGCRIFFCDRTAQNWMEQSYEYFHSRIRKAHLQLGISYFYVEWRQAMAVLLPNSDSRTF